MKWMKRITAVVLCLLMLSSGFGSVFAQTDVANGDAGIPPETGEAPPVQDEPFTVFDQLLAAQSIEEMYGIILDNISNTPDVLLELTAGQITALCAHVSQLDPEGDDADITDLLDTLAVLPNAPVEDGQGSVDGEYAQEALANPASYEYAGTAFYNKIAAALQNHIVSVSKSTSGTVSITTTGENDPWVILDLDTNVHSSVYPKILITYRANTNLNGQPLYVYPGSSGNNFDGLKYYGQTINGDRNLNHMVIDVSAFNNTIDTLRLDIGSNKAGRIDIDAVIICDSDETVQQELNERMTQWGKEGVTTYYAADTTSNGLGAHLKDTYNATFTYDSNYSAYKLTAERTCLDSNHYAGIKGTTGIVSCSSNATDVTTGGHWGGKTGAQVYNEEKRVMDPYVYLKADDGMHTSEYQYVVLTYLCPVENKSDCVRGDGRALTAGFYPWLDDSVTYGYKENVPIQESVYYKTIVVDLTKASGGTGVYEGDLTGVRLDFFEDDYIHEGDVMYLYAASFCKDKNLAEDWIEDNVPEEPFGKLAYDISFDYNGGVAGSHELIGEPYVEIAEASHTFSWKGTPSRTGYTFTGWTYSSSDANLSGHSSMGTSVTLSPMSQDDSSVEVVVTAQWDANVVTYKVNHHLQLLDGQYQLEAWEEKSGFVDSQTAAVAKAYPGYTAKGFSQKQIAANGSTVVDIYYDRNSYPYTFHFYIANTTTPVANDVTGSAEFGSGVEQAALTVNGYELASGTPAHQSITISNIEMNNVKIFYYTEQQATIHYVVVGDSTNTVTRASETVGLATGTVLGSKAVAADKYQFVGWFSDSACTKKVSDSEQYTPQKPAANETVTYYAKFVRAVADLKIMKVLTAGNCADTGQKFIIRVQGEGVDLKFAISAGQTITIPDLPVGKYTVTEDFSWSWRYSCIAITDMDETVSDNQVVLDADGNSITVTNTFNNSRWLSGDSFAENWWGGTNGTVVRKDKE